MNTNEYFSSGLVSANYFLQPGYIFVPETSVLISTVLGSSVSVSIYDRNSGIGGMNHFQLPSISEKKKATALYGNVATVALIKMILQHGSKKNILRHRYLAVHITGNNVKKILVKKILILPEKFCSKTGYRLFLKTLAE